MQKRFAARDLAYVLKGPISTVFSYVRAVKRKAGAPPPAGLSVHFHKVREEKTQRAGRSPDHVAVNIPTTVRLKPEGGRICFSRRWCGQIPQNPRWCAVIHRGMFKGMYQVLEVRDEGITCTEQPMKPFRPTYLRTVPRSPHRLVRHR